MKHLISLIFIFAVTACGGSDNNSFVTTNNLTIFQAASVVIGQADFVGAEQNQGGSIDANTLSLPAGVTVNDGVLYIIDHINSRLLGFDSIPEVNDMPASFVLGQSDFTSTNAPLDELGIVGGADVVISDGRMFVADYSANRVLIWNNVPTTGAVAADVVLGQVDFASDAAVCSATGMKEPASISVAEGRLVVSDSGNNRVLIWNSMPTKNAQPADIVLGQTTFTNCAANVDLTDDGIADGPNESTLNRPHGVWTNGQRLAVLDSSNNRALIWNDFPVSNFAPAQIVLGQSNFQLNAPNDDDQVDGSDLTPSARTLNSPVLGIHSNGQQLYISDTSNNRILIWNSFPDENFTPADVVLGQADFDLNDVNGNVTPTPTPATLFEPLGLYFTNGQLFVADGEHNRVLIYNDQ